MSFAVDKAAVRRSFSLAAESYDRWADAQRKVASILAGLLPPQTGIGAILEVGCGTGIMTRLLGERYPRASLLAIDIAPEMVDYCRRNNGASDLVRYEVGDAERFRAEREFDLVVSSCCFQWLPDRMRAIRNLRAQTARRGSLALAVLVSGSLAELSQCYEVATGRPMPGLNFWSAQRYCRALEGAGFRIRKARAETVRVTWDNPWDALYSLKATGAAFVQQPWYYPLGAGQLRRLVDCYARRFSVGEHGRTPASFEALFALGEAT